MKNTYCELKYCEGCGTLQLRAVLSPVGGCSVCERTLARYRVPLGALKARTANRGGEEWPIGGAALAVKRAAEVAAGGLL
jgi:hypothetical protein